MRRYSAAVINRLENWKFRQAWEQVEREVRSMDTESPEFLEAHKTISPIRTLAMAFGDNPQFDGLVGDVLRLAVHGLIHAGAPEE